MRFCESFYEAYSAVIAAVKYIHSVLDSITYCYSNLLIAGSAGQSRC